MALRKAYEAAERPAGALGLVAPPPIRIEFGDFDGSLAQLFACVRDRKIDLAGVPLLPICEAFFRYLIDLATPNLEENAAALAALAYLLERKAWLLLPFSEKVVEEEEILAIAESSIHEYFEVVGFLRQGYETRLQLFFRSANQGPGPYELPYQIDSIPISALAEALRQVLATPEVPIQNHVTRVGRSLIEEMKLLLGRVTHEWQSFGALLAQGATREDAVYSFLGLLELIRLGQVQANLNEDSVSFARAA